MLHSMRRPLVALCTSVALSVLALALWVVVLNASPPSGPSTHTAAAIATIGSKYCSNWDFLNCTGQEVNDLHIRLNGIQSVTDVFTGTFNTFSSGYITASDVYTLNFSGAWVNESDKVHIGFCSDAPLLRLAPAADPPPFEWTLTGTQVLPNPLFTGVEWLWPTSGHLHLRVVNEQNVTTTLMSAQLLNAGAGLSLDDLNPTVVDTLPMVLDMLSLSGPQTLPPNSEKFFDVYFDAPGGGEPPDHAGILSPPYLYVLETVLVSEADPTDSAHLFAQALAPFIPLYLPIIQR